MPKIINAYSGNESVANSLKSLGDSMFGNQSQQALIRENAKAKGAENENAEPFARAARDGDRNAMAYYGALARKSGTDAANYTLLGTANHARGVDDPGLATAQLGAHEPIASTAVGQGRALANARTIAQMTSDRAAQTQESIAAREDAGRRWQFEHTPESVLDANGVVRFTPRSEAMNQPVGVPGEAERLANARTINDQTTARTLAAEKYKHDNTPYVVYDQGVEGPSTVVSQSEAVHGTHRGAPPSKDQVIGGALQTALRPALTQTASTGTPPAPAAPAASPFANLSPDLRHAAGFPTGNQMFLDPATHHVYLSQDGGQSILVGGQRMPIAGSSLQPIGDQQAAAQAQDNNVRENVPQLAPAPASYSGAANDAARTSGGLAVLKNAWNETAGVVGAGEMNPEQNNAKHNLQNLAMSTRDLVGNVPGRASVQREKWANITIPQPGVFGLTGINAEEQRNRVGSLTAHLRNIYGEVQAEASDPNTPPVERQKLVTYLNNLGRAIHMWEAPEGGPQNAAPQQRVAQPQAGAAPAAQGADPLSQARAAIAAGADRTAVVQRLRQNGINAAGL